MAVVSLAVVISKTLFVCKLCGGMCGYKIGGGVSGGCGGSSLTQHHHHPQ